MSIQKIGPHRQAEVASGKDVNGRFMVTCRDCETCAHAYKLEQAQADLAGTACTPNCQNCRDLRHSHTQKPAVPYGGDCNMILYRCPFDGSRWWQGNTHFHQWQQVTSDAEWNGLRKEHGNPPAHKR